MFPRTPETGTVFGREQGRYLEISQEGQQFHFHCPDEDYPFWHHYFDLNTDYGAFLSSVKKRDHYLQNAANAGSGIRILNQDAWEMIITFIISQQRLYQKYGGSGELKAVCTAKKSIVLFPAGKPLYIFPFLLRPN